MYFEMQIISHTPLKKKKISDLRSSNISKFGEKKKTQLGTLEGRKPILKRKRNLLEVLNLQKVNPFPLNRGNNPKNSHNLTWINLAQIKNMAEFLHYKL